MKIDSEYLRTKINELKIVTSEKSNIESKIKLADFLFDNGLYDEALEQYLNLNSDTIYSKKALCFFKLKDYEQSLLYFKKANDYFGLTLVLLQNKLDDGINFISSLSLNYIELDKHHTLLFDFYIEFIDNLFINNSFEEAIIIIKFLFNFDISDFMLYHFAELSYSIKLYDFSILCSTKAINVLELDITLLLRAQCYFKTQQYKKAISDLNKITEIDSIDFYYLKGKIYLELLEYELAYQNFIEVIFEDENYNNINYYMALTFYKLYNFKDALSFIDKSIKKQQTEKNLFLKVKILFKDFQFDFSLETCIKLLEEFPSKNCIIMLFKLYLELDAFQQGIILGEKYIEYSNDPYYSYYMAKFNFELKKYSSALKYYNLILKNDLFIQKNIETNYKICLEKETKL